MKTVSKEGCQTAFVVLSCMVVSLFLQLIKFDVFPAKYFFDADTVQQFMTGQRNPILGTSYFNTADFFQSANHLFPMDSQFLGGLVIWSLSIIPCTWLSLRYLRATWEHYILIAAYGVLLPVFVWNTHKEVLQFAFFFLLTAIALNAEEKSITTDLLLIGLLVLWSLWFRSYYIITAAGTAGFMILSRLPWDRFKKNIKIEIICLLLFGAISALLFLDLFMPDKLQMIFNGRASVNLARENDPNANTIILEWIENPTREWHLYLLNYIFSAIQMLFPIGLLFKGIRYLPFIVFQFFLTTLMLLAVWSLLRGKWKEKKEKRLLFITISWYLVAFLFEPDFGSFVRHQAAAFPIIAPVLFSV